MQPTRWPTRWRYIFAADEHSGSVPYSFEQVYDQGRKADVWLLRYTASQRMTLADLRAEYEPYSHFQAFCEGRVYGCNNAELIFFEEYPFHPDRRCQYASREYVKTLKEHHVRISMTESGNPKDNAQAERVNSTMKNELLKGKTFHSLKEVTDAVAVAVDFYNNRRPHMSIGMKTLAEINGSTGVRDMKWKSYRMEAIKNRHNDIICENDVSLQADQGLTSGLRPTVNP